ncbi:MAG: tetratricopeptide repeat protein [Ignavibacteriota bacterium]
MKITKLLLALLFASSLLTLDSCRPRASRTKTAKSKTTTAPAATGTSAQQVMSRADSVLAKVSAMSSEQHEIPNVSSEDYPRTPWGSTYIPKPDLSAYSTYEAGLSNFTNGEYDKALANFSQIVVTGRPSELVPNSYYWMGESYFAMERYAEALPYFEYTTKAGPSYKRESAFYKLARSNYNMGNTQAAGMWYERMMAEYPRSSYGTKLKKLGVR